MDVFKINDDDDDDDDDDCAKRILSVLYKMI